MDKRKQKLKTPLAYAWLAGGNSYCGFPKDQNPVFVLWKPDN